MGMFTNYQAELLEHYQPNNIVNSFPTPVLDSKLASTDAGKPYEEYDAKGNHVGYSWSYGETLNLEFFIEGVVTVEPDALVSTDSGVTPDGLIVSMAGKKYYNLKDLKSWRSYLVDGKVVWIQDTEFTYPESGVSLRSMYMPADTYLKDKQVIVTLYNFRMEELHRWTPNVNKSRAVCSIDKELSSKLVKGVYYCSAIATNAQTQSTIFSPSDCVFLVK